MNLDLMVAEAKERLHRSIGQRARFAKEAIAARAKRLRGPTEAEVAMRTQMVRETIRAFVKKRQQPSLLVPFPGAPK